MYAGLTFAKTQENIHFVSLLLCFYDISRSEEQLRYIASQLQSFVLLLTYYIQDGPIGVERGEVFHAVMLQHVHGLMHGIFNNDFV